MFRLPGRPSLGRGAAGVGLATSLTFNAPRSASTKKSGVDLSSEGIVERGSVDSGLAGYRSYILAHEYLVKSLQYRPFCNGPVDVKRPLDRHVAELMLLSVVDAKAAT